MYFLENKLIDGFKYNQFKHDFTLNAGDSFIREISRFIEIKSKGKSFYMQVNEFLPILRQECYFVFKLKKSEYNKLVDMYKNHFADSDYIRSIYQPKRMIIIEDYRQQILKKMQEGLEGYKKFVTPENYKESIEKEEEIKNREKNIRQEETRVLNYKTLDSVLLNLKMVF
jgi:hypothetical protein